MYRSEYYGMIHILILLLTDLVQSEPPSRNHNADTKLKYERVISRLTQIH